MRIIHGHYTIISGNSNLADPDHYWDQDYLPDWSAISGIGNFTVLSNLPIGIGVEPHYHDCDEFWLFSAGKGELWLGNQAFEIAPETMVYTPIGLIHRFQFFTPNAGIVPLVTRLRRHKRPGHLSVETDGPAESPPVPGFVIPGERNTGPFPNAEQSCPLRELRIMTLDAGAVAAEGQTITNEIWIPIEGVLLLSIDGIIYELIPGDFAVLRATLDRAVHARDGARLILARE